ncbi:MAG: hypothetical protein U5P41_11430 [Gammaproteobacteria bacterium]|nr:hypothetical protein [Gammaproteobacteria bacterium]
MNEEGSIIEKATAEGFLHLYNRHFRTTFEIKELSDTPDVRCGDTEGNELNIEVTLTQDRDKDIQALLGRSEHKSIKSLEEHNQRVAEGKETPMFSSLFGNVCENAATKINNKLLMRYGQNTALVARDSSGCDWEWNEVTEELKGKLKLNSNPFDKGIWILNFSKSKLYQIV